MFRLWCIWLVGYLVVGLVWVVGWPVCLVGWLVGLVGSGLGFWLVAAAGGGAAAGYRIPVVPKYARNIQK